MQNDVYKRWKSLGLLEGLDEILVVGEPAGLVDVGHLAVAACNHGACVVEPDGVQVILEALTQS